MHDRVCALSVLSKHKLIEEYGWADELYRERMASGLVQGAFMALLAANRREFELYIRAYNHSGVDFGQYLVNRG